MTAPGQHLIAGRWQAGRGPQLTAIDPTSQTPVWEGHAASEQQIDEALAAARAAQPAWAAQSLDVRIAVLRAFAEQVERRRDAFIESICRHTGKPRWEAAGEVAVMIAKVPRSIEAYHQRCDPRPHEVDGARAAIRFRPHGVTAVFGPFNLPGHLPNGHIVPALLAGNAVILKPSEQCPGIGTMMAECWLDAGVPAGVFALLQGGQPVGQTLAAHRELDGLFFTGSSAAGLALRRAWADQPRKILALEMGGNNPLVVHDVADQRAAAVMTIQSAFVTAGQRCTCARRLIVPEGDAGDRFVDQLVPMIERIRVGPWTDEPEPFMGPVISAQAASRLLATQADLLRRGGRALVAMRPVGTSPTMLRPGLIDVTAIVDRTDEEVFGPLLQLIRVADVDAAIDEANRTAYGLAASLLCDRREVWDRFAQRIRAGVINWNRQTTNASGSMPFGGVGLSGNHRPSGAFAADYCAYPAATLEYDRVAMPSRLPPGLDSESPQP